jgi:hypothetical protein
VLCLLLGLLHNYSERLGRQKAAAAPGSVRPAEEFMRANARSTSMPKYPGRAPASAPTARLLILRRRQRLSRGYGLRLPWLSRSHRTRTAPDHLSRL